MAVNVCFSEAVERGPVLSNIAYLEAATQEGIDPEQGVPALEVSNLTGLPKHTHHAFQLCSAIHAHV